MKTFKNPFKVALYASSLMFLVLAFQNCQAPLNFVSTNPLTASNSSGTTGGSTDHGQGYGGKPSVTFYVGASDVKFSTVAYLGAGSSFSISPALPKGLNLNSVTGDITGTPNVNTIDYTSYAVSAVLASGSTQVLNVLVGVGQVYTIDPTIVGDGLPDANLADHICVDVNGRCSLQAANDQAAVNPVNTRIVLPDHTIIEKAAKGITSDIQIQNSVGAAAAPPAGATLLKTVTCSRSKSFPANGNVNIDSTVQVEIRKYSDTTTKVICGFTSLAATSTSLGKTCALPISADGITNTTQQVPCDIDIPANLITLSCESVTSCTAYGSCGKLAATQELETGYDFSLDLKALATGVWGPTSWTHNPVYMSDGYLVGPDGKPQSWNCN